MRMKVLAFASTAAMLAASAASAGTLTYQSYSVTGDGITITGPNSVSGEAGLIQLTTTSGTVDVWCLDVYDILAGSGTYDVSNLTTASSLPGVPSLDSTQISEIGALMTNGDALVANPGSNTAADVGAAIQVAIWTVEYGSSFTYDTISATVSALTATYLSDAEGGVGSWADNPNVYALSSTAETFGTNQTLGYTVPEASTWAMMLLGFAGLGYAAFRRNLRREAVVG